MTPLAPEKRPLLLGLAAALAALGLILFEPVTRWRDGIWAVLLFVAALSLAWFERRASRRGQPIRLIRWVAGGLAVIATLTFAWTLIRRY